MNRVRSSGTERPSAARVVRYFEGKGVARDSGRLAYRLTGSGAWARSRPAHLFYFFRKIGLRDSRIFLDLGSGDGTACCVAGLFTRAVGIEADPALVEKARRAALDLDLSEQVSFIRADYLTQNIKAADRVYIYPDKPVYAVEDLLQDWPGTLLVYGPHFPPEKMRPVQRLRCGRETLTSYRNDKY